MLGGAGDDTFSLSGLMPFDVGGGAGFDVLIRDDAGVVGANADSFILSAGSWFAGWVGKGQFDGIEQVTVTFGDDDGTVFVDAAPLAAGAGLDLDGGGGNDLLLIDFSALAGTVFTLGAGGVVASNRGTFRGFEAFSIALGGGVNVVTTGAGDDTVEAGGGGTSSIATGAGDDAVWGGSGAETVLGGAGVDRFHVAGLAAGFSIAEDGVGGYLLTDIAPGDGNEGTDRLTDVEWVDFADGSAALPFYGVGATFTGTNGNDVLTGTAFADVLLGLAGNDQLEGGGGDDLLNGGAGNDTIAGGAGFDTLGYDNAGGTVQVNLSTLGKAQATGGAGSDWLVDAFEGLKGSAFGDGLIGNSLDNRIEGLAGNDTIDGGAGADTLIGGLGNDSYTVDLALDVAIENAGEGTDVVIAKIDWTLSATFENLTLFAGTAGLSGTGNDLVNVMTGNAGANLLAGLGGNDRLDGGLGADTMVGGMGNDSYTVDNAADVVIEAAGEGTDTVTAKASWVMSAEVENLTLLAGPVNLEATGNDLANVMTGNAGANLLYGLGGNDRLDGGVGADTLAGGLGNDAYVVDNVADVVIEAAGEGTDTVTAKASWVMSAEVENLALLAGTANFDATGNDIANVITGNAGANVLYGLGGNDRLDGGLGADTLAGGLGNDTYVVDNAADAVIENAGEGTDLVSSQIGWTLGAEVENLTLTGTAGINGIGNALGNLMTGNAAANMLSGFGGNDTLASGGGNDVMIGGAGADFLTGGAGVDTFRFDVLESAANRDTITDFAHLSDRIELVRGAFAAFAGDAAGGLDPLELALGTAATTAAHHLVYAQSTGALYYDADGVGGAAQVQIALLANKPALSAADFLLL